MNKIIVIDQTLREGMQYRGIYFSYQQREKILEFQEALGINVCQSGYPPAHTSEIEIVKKLNKKAISSGYKIKVAGLGRVFEPDIKSFLDSNIDHVHLHMTISEEDIQPQMKPDKIFNLLGDLVKTIRKNRNDAVIGLSILDIGRYDPKVLLIIADYLSSHLKIDILTLPDTSGRMSPNLIFDKIKIITGALKSSHTSISVHCHNDMGMASANTVMGVAAGATVIEASALGIGERNGIADLFTTCALLAEQGYGLDVNVSSKGIFTEYYSYVNQIIKDQSGYSLLNYNTPFFGNGVKTHVAGTHGKNNFGLKKEEDYYINVLCGKHLVKKYLDLNQFRYDKNDLHLITEKIKNSSANMQRSLTKQEISDIITLKTYKIN